MEQMVLKLIKALLLFIKSPLTPLVAGFILLIAYFIRAKTNYLDVKRVFIDYFDIFSIGTDVNGKKGYEKKHIFTIWGIPFLFSLSVVRIEVDSTSLYNTLIVFLSIIIAMFFSILSILISKQNDLKSTTSNHADLLRESGTIILVEVIMCIVCLILSIFLLFAESDVSPYIILIIRIINFYLIFVMLFNILVLIKRLKSLIDNP